MRGRKTATDAEPGVETGLSQPAIGLEIIPGENLFHAVCTGTLIRCAQGDVPVQTLRHGDRVICRDRGMSRLLHVQPFVIRDGAHLVRIPKGAFGTARPDSDVLVPPNQPIAIRGARARMIYRVGDARVAAGRMEDGRIVVSQRVDTCRAYALVFETPRVIYANGLELVSAGSLEDG